MDESEKIRIDRERLMLAVEVWGPRALFDHQVIVRRMERRDPAGIRAVRQRAKRIEVGRDRAWWRAKAQALGTDWSMLRRQRIKVLAWVRAGRPPLAEWRKRASD